MFCPNLDVLKTFCFIFLKNKYIGKATKDDFSFLLHTCFYNIFCLFYSFDRGNTDLEIWKLLRRAATE